MKGSIRFFAGLLIALGAVGTLEVDHQASVLGMMAVGVVGLLVMYSGVVAVIRENA